MWSVDGEDYVFGVVCVAADVFCNISIEVLICSSRNVEFTKFPGMDIENIFGWTEIFFYFSSEALWHRIFQ